MKMRLAIFVLCLIVCWASGDNILTRIHHESDRLADTLHNWFRNTKNLIVFGKLGKVLLNFKEPNQSKGQFSFADLKTLKFDPRRDWGFRIGNWYYIHKDSKVVAVKPVEWDDDNRSKESEVGFEDFSGQNGGEREVGQTSSSPLEPDGGSIPVKSSNIAKISKRDEDNAPGTFSVEVLSPN